MDAQLILLIVGALAVAIAVYAIWEDKQKKELERLAKAIRRLQEPPSVEKAKAKAKAPAKKKAPVKKKAVAKKKSK